MAGSAYPHSYLVNPEAEARTRRLKEIIRSAHLLGSAFLGAGVLVGFAAAGMRRADPVDVVIAMSLGSSGLLYIIFAKFLRRRRYWAWVASFVMTAILFTFVSAFTVWVISRIVSRWEAETAVLGAIPLIGLASWVLALGLILMYLREALPAVREEEAGVQMGFAVIPVAGVASADDVAASRGVGGVGNQAPRDAARERAG
jgi:hypothetical protein